MAKRIACLLLALSLVMGCGISAMAVSSEFPVYVNGTEVEYACSILNEGTTYVDFYFVVQAMYPDAVAAWENGQMVVRATGLTITAKPGESWMVANGRYLYIPGKVQRHPETTDAMVPVRTLAKAMGAVVSYDQNGVYLASGTGPILSGDQFYNAADLDLLARVIRHEAGNQGLAGQMAVGNVILHRVADSRFPNSVYDVLYQPNQFPGATNATPTAADVIAAKLCMDGGDVVPGACWFNGVGRSFWASRHKSLLYTIGNHAFYG